MKTILLISPYWKEKHRWMVSSVKLAELWQRLGYRVVVACMGSPAGERCSLARFSFLDRASPSLVIYRKKDFFLPDPLNFGISFGFSRFVRRIIRAEKPDFIVVNKVLFWTSFAMIPLRLRGYHFLLLTDALVGMTWWPRHFLPKVIMAIGAWTMGWLVLLCAEKMVFFHPQPERLLRFLGVWRKSRVIPTGIDVARYALARSSKPRIVVTYVGRLESVKGADDFVEAIVPLKKDFPAITVQVVGWYKEGHPLVERFRGQVMFTGLRDDIPAILAATDIFVMPSYSEGLSNAVMEAMASGCACVVSDVGGNRFLVQNGVSGFLFSPGDREALKAHVRRLIEDPTKRHYLGAAARKRIEEEFSWEKVGEEYRRLFRELEHGGATVYVMQKPRVVILSAFLSPFRSGAEACVEEVAARLAERFDVTIVTARLRRDSPRKDFLPPLPPPERSDRSDRAGNPPPEGEGIPVIRMGFGFFFDKWLFPFLAPFAVRRLRPDIVHAVLETFAGAALWGCRWIVPSAKRVLTLQTTNRSFLKCSIIRSAHTVTAISSVLVAAAQRRGRDAVLIPNGVDYEAIREACARHPKVAGRILFVGRLEKMKGVDTLLAAFAQLPVAPTPQPPPPAKRGEGEGHPSPAHGGRAGVGGHLRIVGDGSLRKQLSVARDVQLVGYLPVPDLYREYAEAEIFCALPRSEAMGNVFLEAQAAGCAVIGTRVGGVPDIVLHGKTGILIPPDDAGAAAETLALLLKDQALRARLSSAAVAHAAQYDWSGIAGRYEQLYLTNL